MARGTCATENATQYIFNISATHVTAERTGDATHAFFRQSCHSKEYTFHVNKEIMAMTGVGSAGGTLATNDAIYVDSMRYAPSDTCPVYSDCNATLGPKHECKGDAEVKHLAALEYVVYMDMRVLHRTTTNNTFHGGTSYYGASEINFEAGVSAASTNCYGAKVTAVNVGYALKRSGAGTTDDHSVVRTQIKFTTGCLELRDNSGELTPDVFATCADDAPQPMPRLRPLLRLPLCLASLLRLSPCPASLSASPQPMPRLPLCLASLLRLSRLILPLPGPIVGIPECTTTLLDAGTHSPFVAWAMNRVLDHTGVGCAEAASFTKCEVSQLSATATNPIPYLSCDQMKWEAFPISESACLYGQDCPGAGRDALLAAVGSTPQRHAIQMLMPLKAPSVTLVRGGTPTGVAQSRYGNCEIDATQRHFPSKKGVCTCKGVLAHSFEGTSGDYPYRPVGARQARYAEPELNRCNWMIQQQDTSTNLPVSTSDVLALHEFDWVAGEEYSIALRALQLGEAGPMANARRLLNKPQFSEASSHMLAMPQGTVSTPTATTESATASTSIGFEIVTALASDHQAGKSSGNSSSMVEVKDWDTSDWLPFKFWKIYKHSQFNDDWFFSDFKLGADQGNLFVLFLLWTSLGFVLYMIAFSGLRYALKKLEVDEGRLQPFEFKLNDAEIITQVMNLRWVGREKEAKFYIAAIMTIFFVDAAFLGFHPGFLLPNILFSMNPDCLKNACTNHVAGRRIALGLLTCVYAVFSVFASSINLAVHVVLFFLIPILLCYDTNDKYIARKGERREREAKREPVNTLNEKARFIL